MKKRLVFLIIGILFISYVYGFDYVINDARVCTLGLPPSEPERGVPFVNPCFGTTMVRLTDTDVDSGAQASNFDSAMLRYVKFSPENADETRALIRGRGSGYYLLYNVDRSSPNLYSFIKQVNFPERSQVSEPRWDAVDPNIFYFVYGMGFYQYNLSTESYSLIRDFTDEFPSRTDFFTDDEGDSSANSRYWCWFTFKWEDGNIVKKEVFCYDKDYDNYYPDDDGKQGKIMGILTETNLSVRHGKANTISVTDTGNKVVVFSDYGEWNCGSYDLDFTNGLALDVWANHADTAVDVNGNEVLFGYDQGGQGFKMVDLNTGEIVKLLSRPWPNPSDYVGVSYGTASGVHSSTKPGWGLYSAYTSLSQNCGAYDKFDCVLIFLMELKDVGHSIPYGYDPSKVPRIWQLAYSYSQGCYQAQPNAVMNRAGSRVYFTSRWNYQDACDLSGDTEDFETYIIELPSNWYEDLSGPLQSCFDLDGDCCSSGQTCEGGSFQLSSDCGSLCCVDGMCQSPSPTCQSLGYDCCDSCETGTEHPEYDGDCGVGKVCCGSCATTKQEEIIFETNFDNADDWTITQGSNSISNVFPSYSQGIDNFPSDYPASGTGARYIGWYESRTFMNDNVHDTVTLDSSHKRGSSGKAITHWSEVAITSPGGDASDGTLYVSLTDEPGNPKQGYDEIWVSLWRQYDSDTPYYSSKNMQKYIHISSYNYSEGSLTNWFGNVHLPDIVAGTQGDDSMDNGGDRYRWFYNMINLYPAINRNDYNFQSDDLDQGIYKSGSGKYINVYANLSGGNQHGGWQNIGNYGDGDWHFHEWHIKMNSGPGVKDGVYEYFIDSIPQHSVDNIPFVASGNEMVKWNLIVFGGNNDYYDPEGEYETWYAYDDIVVSTYRVGPDYVIETSITCGSGADKDNSGVVSINEVVDFIDKWKNGEVTIDNVLEAIGEWKNGC